MSKLNEVLKVLGLKVGEEFLLFKNGERIPGRYHFTDVGKMVARSIAAPSIYLESKFSLNDLITRDDLRLEPAPFIPKDGEEYWTLADHCELCKGTFNNHDAYDLFRLSTEFCFRTKEEAEENKDKFLKLMQDIRRGSKLVLEKSNNQ